MSFFGFLFIILLCLFLPSLIRIISAAFRFRSQMKNAYRQAASAAESAARARRPGGWSEPRPSRRKVITREMGEYVAYEDVAISTTTTASDGSRTTTTVEEEQITDVEWEEIR